MIRKEPHGLPVDIWSYAICLMELANGRLPHRKSSLLAMFKAATEGVPHPLESTRKWSPAFLDFLRQCLHSDPTERATSAQLYEHPWLEKRAKRSEMKACFTTINAACNLLQTS